MVANAVPFVTRLLHIKNICDMVKAISDYCEAARKVAPDYQRMATDACMMEIVRQMLIDKQVK